MTFESPWNFRTPNRMATTKDLEKIVGPVALAAVDADETSLFRLQQDARIAATIGAEVDPVAQSLSAALPATYDRVTRSKDSAPSAVKLYVTGSSISVLGGASAEAFTPGPLVAAALQSGLSPLGHVNVTYSIDGQNGSVVNDWGARYTTWRASNPAPQVALIVAGMNDFTPYSWHNGQTFDSFPGTYGFVTKLQQLVDQLAADGVEVILSTTPHRHTGRLPYGGGIDPAILAGGVTYPDAVYTPDGSSGNPHVRDYTLPSGETIEVEYRFLRGNEAIRSIATEKGCVLLDAERYYFEAAAKHGQDALYDAAQYNHPNDFGIAQSYGRAAAALRLGLRKPTMQATAKKVTSQIGASVFARRTSSLQRTTTTLSIDPQLQVPLAAGTYIVDAALSFYQNGTDATDLKIQPSAPGDATGAWGLIGPATTTTDVKAGDASHQAQLNLTSSSNVGMIQNQPTLITVRAVVTIVTAGTFGIQWAPTASPGAVFLNSPLSHMRVTRVA